MQTYYDKTISGKEFDFDSLVDVYVFRKCDQVWAFLFALGYELKDVDGVFKSVVTLWFIVRHRFWVLGDDGTLSLFVKILMDENPDYQNSKNKEVEKIVLIAVCCLFCFDRAIAASRHSRIIDASKWLQAADELFYLSSRANNLTEKQLRREIASKGAFAKNKEVYELKRQAVDYWCKNIDIDLSNEKAAAMLSRIVPLSHRKLSEYVSEAKRLKIHPASKV